MTTFTAYPNADAAHTSSGSWSTTGTSILNGFSSLSRQAVFGFSNVTIANAATISSAVFDTYISSGGGSGTLALRLTMEDADNPAFPTSVTDSNGRTLTTATADFSGSRPSSGSYYTWPDFTSVVQEVVDRAGWASGNAMNLFIRDNGSSSGTYTQYYSIDQTGTSMDPYITINYTEPANPARPFLRRRTRTFRRAF